MDSKTIETLSINAVTESIDVCDYLQQFISSNDKYPSWDGEVIIYDGVNKSKDHIKGRMPVQVKGKVSEDLSADSISFGVDVSDLDNYLHDGGVMYFVVLIRPITLEKKIYYSELTPIKLRVLLGGLHEGQKKKSITLRAFPSDNKQKANVFLSCRADCDKQASYISATLPSLEELMASESIESLAFSAVPIGFSNQIEAIVGSEVYLYAKLKGSAILQPIEAIPDQISVVEKIDASVFVDGEKYYDSYSVITSSEEKTVKIGDSLQITISKDAHQYTINYKNPDSIRRTARDLKFILAVLDIEHIEIGQTSVPLVFGTEEKEKFGVMQAKAKMDYYSKACAALDLLNCSGDLIPSEMSDSDWRNLDILITAFVEGKAVSGLRKNLDFIHIMILQEYKFLLVFQKDENQDGTYTILDFFGTDLNVAYRDDTGNYKRISQYSILKADDYLGITNVRYNVILQSFLCFRDDGVNMERLNWHLLELIKAYDKKPCKELMNTIEDISTWLLENLNNEELPYEVRILNRLQVIKRQRDLNQSEMKKLNEIAQAPGERDDVLAGTYLLMGNPVLADVYLARLDENMRNEFLQYPIYKFHG